LLLLLLLSLLLPPLLPQPEMADGPIDVEQAFTLHSRPAAVRKILLDFDGHVTVGADWNTAFQRREISTPAFDTVSTLGGVGVLEGGEKGRCGLGSLSQAAAGVCHSSIPLITHDACAGV
jgi:hypothetical protein